MALAAQQCRRLATDRLESIPTTLISTSPPSRAVPNASSTVEAAMSKRTASEGFHNATQRKTCTAINTGSARILLSTLR